MLDDVIYDIKEIDKYDDNPLEVYKYLKEKVYYYTHVNNL